KERRLELPTRDQPWNEPRQRTWGDHEENRRAQDGDGSLPGGTRHLSLRAHSNLRFIGTTNTSTSSHPVTLSNGFCQPDRPANRAAAHSHQRQQTRRQRRDRVQMLLLDCKVEQGKGHSTADHMTRQGLRSEQARWAFPEQLLHLLTPRGSSPCRYSRKSARPRWIRLLHASRVMRKRSATSPMVSCSMSRSR